MNMSQKSQDRYYHRGREARMRGESRDIDDGRVSPESRQAWYAGWDYQDLQLGPKPTAAQREKTKNFLANLREQISGSQWETASKPLH